MSNAVILTDSHRRHRHGHAQQAVEAQRLGYADARRDRRACSATGIAIPRCKAVIMTGAGERAFCAGQDLEETEKFQSGIEGANWFQSWRDFYNAIRDLDKPCLAALNGVAAGSAFQAVMLTDVRVGHPGVRMGQPEINAGIPSVTGPMLMLPRIGLARTMELTLTGRMMEAEEARLDRPHQLSGRRGPRT